MSFAPRKLFLIDGLGAVLTATLLAAVLAQFESTFGMPSNMLYFLASIAVVFAVYSLTCYWKTPENWPYFLQGIAVVNLSYCMLTAAIVAWFRNEMTWIGVGYFVGETFVVSTLAGYEMITARRAADR